MFESILNILRGFRLMRFLLISLFLFFGASAQAADERAGQRVLMDYVSPLIYDGTRSLPGEFPAMGWIGNCTGTLVAPNVLFTAAHCVTTGKRITFNHRGTGNNYAATCTRHPSVNTRNWYNDYALCKLDNAVPAGSVLVSFKAVAPDVGQKLLLNGLGAPNVRTHYWGQAPVRRISGQDIVTCGPANLGGGDSGGSLLEWTEDRTGASGFYVVGVNSRGGGGCSYFNKIADSSFTNWARQYERDKGVQLCGISADCRKQPDPQPCESEFAAVKKAFDELSACRCEEMATALSAAAAELAVCLAE